MSRMTVRGKIYREDIELLEDVSDSINLATLLLRTLGSQSMMFKHKYLEVI